MLRDVSAISCYQETTRGFVGSSEFCVVPGPSREVTSETTPALDDSKLISRVKGQISGFRKIFQKGSGNLAKLRVSADSSSYVSTSTVSSTHDGRFLSGLGGSLTSTQGLRTLPQEFQDWSMNQLELQAIFSLPGVFLVHSTRESSFDNVEQFNSWGMFQEPRNPEVSVSFGAVKEVPRVLRSTGYYSNS